MIELADTEALHAFVRAHLTQPGLGHHVAILFGGDRGRCCDRSLVAKVDGEVVGLASIAPQGEDYSGQPALVGLLVLPEHRGQGLGTALLAEVARLAPTWGWERVRIETLSTASRRALAKLPPELAARYEHVPCGSWLDL